MEKFLKNYKYLMVFQQTGHHEIFSNTFLLPHISIPT